MNASSLTSLSSRNALKAIRDITDIGVLREALEQEGASESPRSTVIGAIQLRMDTLRDSQGEVVVDDAAWQITTVDDGAIVESDIGAEIVPAHEAKVVESVEVEAVERTDADNCAAAFFAALRSGDEKLVTVLISEVRREGADDAGMAAALIRAFSTTIKAQTKVLPNKGDRKPRQEKEPGNRAMTRLQAGIKAGITDSNGVVTINRSAMDAAGWTRVWFGWAHEWDCGKTGNARLGPKGILAQAAGYTAILENEDTDAAVLTLTPING